MGKGVIIKACHLWGLVSYKIKFVQCSLCMEHDLLTGLSLVIIRLILREIVTENALSLTHYDGSSFLLPQSILVAAQNETEVCKAKVYAVIYCSYVYCIL